MKKKKHPLLTVCVLVFLLVFVGNELMTAWIRQANLVCRGQRFSSAEEAMDAYEAEERASNSTSLNVCPPYRIIHTFDYEENTIALYSFCDEYDGEESNSYAICVLKHHNDGTLSFDDGFAYFILQEPDGDESYYYFTNINTRKGRRSMSFLYLPANSNKDVYVDGNKSEKILISAGDQDFYLCYALSKRDTFLSNLLTPISHRHTVQVQ